jgi:CRISPR/Cas system CSM-associated protein Csm3 (group 7 of RAMP superfamily)
MNIKTLYLDNGSVAVKDELSNIEDIKELKKIFTKSFGTDYLVKRMKDKEQIIEYIVNKLENHPLNNWDVWNTESKRIFL